MQLNGARILIECLIREGVNIIFGYPGGSVLDIYDELPQYGEQLRHVLVRHEQAAVHAADGYARATGKVGVCMATSGPGATNTVTGIATAYCDSIPMVIFTGQVPTGLIGICHMMRGAVGLGEDRNRKQSHLPARTHDAQGNLTSVGNQYFLNHFTFSLIYKGYI